MRRRALPSVCSFALLIFGCPKRQTTPLIVYVPSPPAAATPTPAQASEVLVIEEPEAPSEPQEVGPQAPTTSRPARRRTRIPRTSPEPSETPSQPAEPQTMEVPPLEPLESSQQEAALRRRILILQQRVQSRIAQPDRERLSSAERKTLEDARTFLAQSARALEQGDLQRALTLASKASQLVGSLEEAR